MDISIIIPVYNAAQYLADTLENLTALTLQRVEFICVDDGSTDDSVYMLERYAKYDPRFVIVKAAHGGVSAARNLGLSIAAGSYIMFMDADDAFVTDTMNGILQYLDTETELFLFPHIVRDAGTDSVCTLDAVSACQDIQALRMAAVVSKEINSVWAMVYQRQVIAEHRLQFVPGVRMGEDLIFNLQYLQCITRFRYCEALLYIYKLHEGSVTATFDDTRYQDLLAVYPEMQKAAGSRTAASVVIDDFLYYVKIGIKYTGRDNIRAILGDPDMIDAISRIAQTARPQVWYRAVFVALLRHRHMQSVVDCYALRGMLVRWCKALKRSLLDRRQEKQFLHTDAFRRLRHTKGRRRVILLDTPAHGNLGDHAIIVAQKQFLREMAGQDLCIEFTHAQWKWLRSRLPAMLTQQDLVVLPGGGFLGTLWEQEEAVVLDILACLAAQRLVIFPQTIYFAEDPCGEKALARFLQTVEKCRDLTLFVRDEASYQFGKQHLPRTCTCVPVPDIVTYLTPAQTGSREKTILKALRKDRERILVEPDLDAVLKASARGYRILDTDTVLDSGVLPTDRDTALQEKLREFGAASLVITDRLHGMLFAAVTGTPCIAFDNVSGKVRGQYQWIRYLPYIRFVKRGQLTGTLVETLLASGPHTYTNAALQPYYAQMAEVIAEKGVV